MFPGHFKIPGHSGTAIKHRKGFLKQKELLRQKQRVTGKVPSLSRRSYERRSISSNHSVFHKIFLLLLLGSLIICGPYVKSLIDSEIKQQWQVEEDRITKQADALKHNYFRLINDGHAYLQEGNLKAAQYSFELALESRPYGKQAIVSITQTLNLQCEKLQANCESAQAYTDYVEAVGW